MPAKSPQIASSVMPANHPRGSFLRRKVRSNARRRLSYESLERRIALVAPTDLQAITGRVFADLTGDGFTAGEEVSGATVNVYRDNGDGVFNAATDTVFRSATTGTDGRYRVDSVTVGNYFVQQPAQTVGGRTLSQRVSPLILVDATDVAGRRLRTIDSFDAGTQLVSDDTNDGVPVTSTVLAPTTEVIGGERDLLVNKTSVNGRIQLSVNDPLLPGFFSFDSLQTGQGRRVVSWDGIDGNANVINDAGLGVVDLTSAGTATGLQLQIGADSATGSVTIRLYTDDGTGGTSTRFSTGTFPLPDTGGAATVTEFLAFTGFTVGGGGGADLTRIGAIEMEITGQANVNGAAELVGAIGPNVETFDIANFESADLRLSKTVNSPSSSAGQNVIFTITINNDGPNAANGVVVTDLLPAGLAFVSSTPSQGTYNSTNGQWSLGTIANGASATLALTARATTAGALTNVAEITASSAFDADSTPGNNVATEDDRAVAVVNVEAADLSLTNVVNRTAARVGENVIYTITLSNAGPSTATGVTVSSVIPAGLTLVSNTPSVGSFNGSIWNVGTLANGATATLALTTRIDTIGSKTVTAQVTAANQSDPDSTPNNNLATEDDQASATVVVASSDLSLTKTVTTTTPNVGQNVTFTLTVRNSGPDAATGVTVRDLLPAGLNFVSATPPAAYDATTGIWTIGSLAANANSTLQIIAVPANGGSFNNTAEIITSDQQDSDSTPNNNVATEDDQATVTVNAQQIDLSLTKTVDNPTPNRGSTVVFTTTLSNAGPSAATGITVRDALPSGFTFQSATPSVGTYNNSTGIWSVPTLAAGGAATLVISAVVNTNVASTATAQVISANQADVDSTPNNNLEAEDDQQSVQIAIPTADLSLVKTASTTTPNVGQEVTFTVIVSNSGPSGASGVIISDVLPAGLVFASANVTQGDFAPTTGRWTVGTLAADSTATLTLVARVTTPGVKTNTAQIIAADQFDPDSTPANNVATEDDQASVQVTPQRIDLSLTKTTNRPRPNVGEEVTFTLTVTNAGPNGATQVQVRDQIPTGLTFVSANPSVGTFDPITGIWSIPTLGAAASATLPIVVTYDSPMMITNTAEVIAADQSDVDSTPGNNAANEDDRATLTLTPATADLSLTKTVSTATPNFGQSVAFTIALANGGPDAATGVTVLDLLPADIAFVSANPSLGTYDPVTGIWNVGTLASAGRATLVINGTPTTTGAKTNSAQLQKADQFDPDSTPGNSVATEDDQASVTVTPQRIDLSLTKTIDRATPNVGENVTYRLTLQNAGPSTATGIRVRDLLPTGTSFVSSSSSSGAYVASTGIWTPTALAANATATLTIIARVTAPGVVNNAAEVIAADQPDIDSTPGNGAAGEDDITSVEFATPVADLSITKTADNLTPNRDDRVTFTVIIRNSGPDGATNIVVNDRLPAGFNFVDSSTTAGNYVSTAGTWNIPALANGQSATLTIVGTPRLAGPKVNTAEIIRTAQGDPDSTPGNGLAGEDDIASVTVTPALIDLSVRATIDNLAPKVGDIVTVTFTVNNFGPMNATGATLATVIPPGVTLIDNQTSLGAFDPATRIWSIDSLTPGQTETLTLTFSVDAPGIKQTSIEVTDADQFDSDSTPANGLTTEDDFATVAINAPRVLTKRLFLSR
jgi:large repetitive protein